jgi:hypothetical protein
MSFGFNYPALFRAHNTATQTGIGVTGPFSLQFSEGCEIIGVYNRLNVRNNAYMYGDIKINGGATSSTQSYDISFTPTALISSMVSEGWQVASEINLTVMTGDDGVYNVVEDDAGLIVAGSVSASGGSSADQTRIFGVRVEVTP